MDCVPISIGLHRENLKVTLFTLLTSTHLVNKLHVPDISITALELKGDWISTSLRS